MGCFSSGVPTTSGFLRHSWRSYRDGEWGWNCRGRVLWGNLLYSDVEMRDPPPCKRRGRELPGKNGSLGGWGWGQVWVKPSSLISRDGPHDQQGSGPRTRGQDFLEERSRVGGPRRSCGRGGRGHLWTPDSRDPCRLTGRSRSDRLSTATGGSPSSSHGPLCPSGTSADPTGLPTRPTSRSGVPLTSDSGYLAVKGVSQGSNDPVHQPPSVPVESTSDPPHWVPGREAPPLPPEA